MLSEPLSLKFVRKYGLVTAITRQLEGDLLSNPEYGYTALRVLASGEIYLYNAHPTLVVEKDGKVHHVVVTDQIEVFHRVYNGSNTEPYYRVGHLTMPFVEILLTYWEAKSLLELRYLALHGQLEASSHSVVDCLIVFIYNQYSYNIFLDK